MASEIDICNLALEQFGERPITALNDDSDAGRLCGVYYEPTRDEVLRAHRWNFATKRVALSRLADAPVFKYDFVYQLPDDFVRAMNINEINVFDVITNFEIEQGRRLLCNDETVNLRYIFRQTDPTKFDALFIEALSLKLASKLSTSLSEEEGIAKSLLNEYKALTEPLAKQVDSEENGPGLAFQPSNSRLARARRQGSTYGDGGSSGLNATSGTGSGTGGQASNNLYRLNDLLDVSTADQADQFALVFDAASGLWIAQANPGDVVGPSVAIDNRFAAFDGITGKLIQDGGVSAASLAIVKQWGIKNNSGITTGLKDAYITIPCACTLTKWELFSDVVGDLVLDLWNAGYAGFPPSVAGSVTGTLPPTLSSADKATDDVLDGWTTTYAAGDKLLVNVDSAATVNVGVLEMYFTPTA